jgi:GIY-YIG catalytic domain
MPEFYYQIKCQNTDASSEFTWAFPPLFCGKVAAADKKAAKLLIEEDYGRRFPLRVLKKDLEGERYLLGIEEILDRDDRTKGLFEFRECLNCNASFRTIDLYNDHNERYKGKEYCGSECKKIHLDSLVTETVGGSNGKHHPIIYRVLNTVTGKSYIGQTTQVFTLRWYQHFFQYGSCKFHQAIKESKFEDWQFMVVETLFAHMHEDIKSALTEREKFWIKEFNTIDEGYNSL